MRKAHLLILVLSALLAGCSKYISVRVDNASSEIVDIRLAEGPGNEETIAGIVSGANASFSYAGEVPDSAELQVRTAKSGDAPLVIALPPDSVTSLKVQVLDGRVNCVEFAQRSSQEK